jgi:hypothetical protein
MTSHVTQGDTIYTSPNQFVGLSTQYSNALKISNIGHMSSLTPSFTAPICQSSISYVNISVSSALYGSNDRSGAFTITWTTRGIFNASLPRGTILFNNDYNLPPKVYLSNWNSVAATTGAVRPIPYVKTSQDRFDIYTDQDGDTAQVAGYFYLVEE